MTSADADLPDQRGLETATFLLSAVLLALEVAHVRLLSYTIDPRLVYGAISIAMAGLGGASIWVSMRPELAEGDVRRRVAWCGLALAVSIVLSSVGLAYASPSFAATSLWTVLSRALPLLVLVALPYVPGGLALALALTGARGRTHAVYAANLAGSAVGCFGLYPFLHSPGLETAIVGLGGLAALGAAVLGGVSGARPLAGGAALLGLALFALAPSAARWMPFAPDPHDLMGVAVAAYRRSHPHDTGEFRPTREFARWDPVSRVEVFSFPGDFGTLNGSVPIKLVTQDGGAGSILVGFGDDEDARSAWADRSVYSAGYIAKPAPDRVLAIGMGGGVDVMTALHHGARDVTAVEINAAMVEASQRRFGAFQNGLLSRPGVTVVHADGRSFVEQAAREGRRWPFIQMSGADTYSAGGGGAFMFSESYLYTVDAFRRYLAALDDDGVLALIRFGPEPLRAVISEAIALQETGVADVRRHFLVLRQGICAGIVLSKKPLDAEAGRRLVEVMQASTTRSRVSLPMWNAMGFGIDEPLRLEYAPGLTPGTAFDQALTAVASGDPGRLAAFLESQPLDQSPTSDDRPFFFQFLKARDWPRVAELGQRDFFAAGLLGHFRMVSGFVALTALLTLLPPWLRRRRGADPLPLEGWPLPYFALLGAAYMLVELSLIQRTVLALGHPTYSVSITLAALLLGSGLGASQTGPTRLGRDPARSVALAAGAIAGLLLLHEIALPSLVSRAFLFPFVVRCALLFAAIFPLGVAMGIPFPLGLSEARRLRGPEILAFGLGINGFVGVLTSLIAVPAAMLTGFRALLFLAALLYGAAAWWMSRREASSAGPAAG
jgi:hypothetical protein